MVLIQDHTLTQPTLAEVMACNAASGSRAGVGDLPVMHGRDLVGIAYDGRWRPATHYEKRWAAWTKYDDYKTSMSSKKSYRSTYRANTLTNSDWYDLWAGPQTVLTSTGSVNGTARTARQFSEFTDNAGIRHGGNVSTDVKHIVGFEIEHDNGSATDPLPLLAYDRVLAYDNCSISTSSQNMTNTLTAQRYNGSGLPGMQIMIVVGTTTLGATASNITTLTYVDQDGNTATCPTGQALGINPGQDLGEIVCPVISSNNVTFGPFMPLATGDGGVRSITDYQCSANNTGDLSMVLAKPLAWVYQSSNHSLINESGFSVSFVDTMVGLERVYDGACISMLYRGDGNSNGTSFFRCTWIFAWG